MKLAFSWILVVYFLVYSQTILANQCIAFYIAEATIQKFGPGEKFSTDILDFLNAPQPKYEKVVEAVNLFETLDTSSKNSQKSLEWIKAPIQALALRLIETSQMSNATAESLQITSNKLRLLNMPSLRNLLTERQQSQIAELAWAYNRALWSQQLDVSTKIKIINGAHKFAASVSVKQSQASDRLNSFASINVVSGDAFKLPADAFITTIECKGFCSGALHAQLRDIVGDQLRDRALYDGEILVFESKKKPNIGVRNVVLVVDSQTQPLHKIILNALLEAENSGFKSAVLPAIRTGDAFGAVETSYDQIVRETVKGVSLFLEKSKGMLNEITFSVRSNEALAQKLTEAIKRAQRERSLREDLREAKLSGIGFVVRPSSKRKPVDTTQSPIYKSMLVPWDLAHLMEKHVPILINRIDDIDAFNGPVVSVLNMPIKLLGTDFRVPVELEKIKEFLQKIVDHEVEINPEMDNFYAYLTVDHNVVKAGSSHRRGGVHIDGVQGARYKVKIVPEHTYSVSNTLGTIFYDQAFDLRTLDPNNQHVHAELERQAKKENQIVTQDYGIYFWDSYSPHETGIARKDLVRTFVRVEFSKKMYDAVGDTVNPLFEYDWPRTNRPIPEKLDDRPKTSN